MESSSFIIIGAGGQLGTALRQKYPDARTVDSNQLDISDRGAVDAYDWSNATVILNAAAYTNVDGAETPEGRAQVWKVNAVGPANLARIALEHDMTLVQISTDYVFDGETTEHLEDELFSPLGVYGQSKAAGDIAVSLAPKHYILRTSWVMGSGGNFVRSIMGLAARDISPHVVADQFGRPTFTTELARGIDHLLQSGAQYGTYNLSNGGEAVNWATVARQVYKELGRTDLTVGDTTAEAYFAGKLSSPRPTNSTLNLDKIKAAGFVPVDWRTDLKAYIEKEESA